MQRRHKILLVGYDLLLERNLEMKRYKVVVLPTTSGSGVCNAIQNEKPDLVVLAQPAHNVTIMEVICECEDFDNIPIFVFVDGNEDTRARILDMGADDCLSIPYSLTEACSRVGAILRRTSKTTASSEDDLLVWGDITVNLTRHRVWRDQKETVLPPSAYSLLIYLMQNPGRVFSREQLISAAWEDMYINPKGVNVCVRRLRQALSDTERSPVIRAVRGVGYGLHPEAVIRGEENLSGKTGMARRA